MWSYYGSKTKIAALYPKPLYNRIIEPFAGAAKYSLLHFESDVILIDLYEPVIKIWKWLQECSENDILSLPILKPGDSIEKMTFDSEAAKLFMGYMVGRGLSRPQYKVSPFVASEKQYHFKYSYQRIAKSLYKIRHWKFIHGNYFDHKNEIATWFIDPPYQFGGKNYPCHKIDYEFLAAYSKSRMGQTIVCENSKANWLNFLNIKEIQGSNYKTTEAIWTNHHTHFNNVQQELILT